jgi:hypothetical protein
MVIYSLVLLGCFALGALVGRYWIVALPVVVSAGYLLVRYLLDPSCSATCGEDDTWESVTMMWAMFVLPAPTLSMLVGVIARRARSRLR